MVSRSWSEFLVADSTNWSAETKRNFPSVSGCLPEGLVRSKERQGTAKALIWEHGPPLWLVCTALRGWKHTAALFSNPRSTSGASAVGSPSRVRVPGGLRSWVSAPAPGGQQREPLPFHTFSFAIDRHLVVSPQ